MNTKKYEIKIVSPKGHDLLTLDTPAETVEALREHEAKGKWIMVDGENVSGNEITEDLVRNAENLNVVNQLVGG